MHVPAASSYIAYDIGIKLKAPLYAPDSLFRVISESQMQVSLS